MKFSVAKETLQNALAAIGTGISRAAGTPILGHLLIRAGDGELKIAASDMEVFARISVEADISEPGEIAVPSAKMNSLVKAFSPDGALNARLDGERFVLQSGRGRFALSTLPANEFVEMQPDTESQSVSIPANALSGILSRVAPAMAVADVRTYLNAILLKACDGVLTAVATDGHRLAKAHTEIEAGDAEFSILVPRKAVTEILRILRGRDADVSISAGPHALALEVGAVRFVTRLIDGRYPDYEAITPNAQKDPVVVDSDNLKAGLARVAVVSDQKTRAVMINIDGNELKLNTKSFAAGQVEDGAEQIELQKEHEPRECAFNLNYLNDAIGAVESDSLQLHLYGTDAASVVTAEDDQYHSFHVIMPIKI